MSPTAVEVAAPFAWFTGGVACWSLATSMNQIVMSWLLVGELQESAGWVGAAQMCQQLPYLVFLLPGGLLADRSELRGLAARLHVLGALGAGGLAATIAGGCFGLPVLLLHALCWGTLQALASPCRDAMLARVATGDLLRAVTLITLVQYLAGAAGAQLGGLAGRIGSAAALALQAAVLVLGLLAVRRLPRAAPSPRPAGERGEPGALRSGLRAVARSRRLRPLALLVAANGLLFMGPFQVLCPLLVRERYHGGAFDLALPVMVLPLGVIAGSLAMLLRGGVRRRWRAFHAALVGVALCLLAIAAGPPFWAFVGLIFVWGVFHSIFLNTSRALFQELAGGPHRARILAVHPLGTLGMAPLSNLGAGLLAGAAGLAATCLAAGLAMLAVVGVALAAAPARRAE